MQHTLLQILVNASENSGRSQLMGLNVDLIQPSCVMSGLNDQQGLSRSRIHPLEFELCAFFGNLISDT